MSNDKCCVCKDVMFGNDDTCHDCQGVMCDGCSHIIQTRVNGVKLICTTCLNQRKENEFEQETKTKGNGMKKIEKALLEQLRFIPGNTGNGFYRGSESVVFNRATEKYSLGFKDKSFIEVIRLIHSISNNDFELSYAGYLIRIYLHENVLMGEVFDEQQYNNEHKDEQDMAQHTRLPLAAALNWIEQRLEDVAKGDNIDDLPFPKTVEVEKSDLKLFFGLSQYVIHSHELTGEKLEAYKRIKKVVES